MLKVPTPPPVPINYANLSAADRRVAALATGEHLGFWRYHCLNEGRYLIEPAGKPPRYLSGEQADRLIADTLLPRAALTDEAQAMTRALHDVLDIEDPDQHLPPWIDLIERVAAIAAGGMILRAQRDWLLFHVDDTTRAAYDAAFPEPQASQ